jgi:DNA-directed RNA polymerase subunit RPC12/RpoP
MMSTQCPNCGVQLGRNWKFCADCGTTLEHEPEKHEQMESVRAPVQGTFGGLFLGVIATPILIIVGTMLCLTGLGAIAGVPMIIAGVIAPLLGPLIGFGALRGKCPWCGSSVNTVANSKDFGCHACSRRIHIVNQHFERAA